MNAELLHFNMGNGEHNSEGVSTFVRDIIPLTSLRTTATLGQRLEQTILAYRSYLNLSITLHTYINFVDWVSELQSCPPPITSLTHRNIKFTDVTSIPPISMN